MGGSQSLLEDSWKKFKNITKGIEKMLKEFSYEIPKDSEEIVVGIPKKSPKKLPLRIN